MKKYLPILFYLPTLYAGGFYAGAGTGVVHSNVDYHYETSSHTELLKAGKGRTNAVVGIFGGYDWTWGDTCLLGPEFSINYTNMDISPYDTAGSDDDSRTFTIRIKRTWASYIGARLGWRVKDVCVPFIALNVGYSPYTATLDNIATTQTTADVKDTLRITKTKAALSFSPAVGMDVFFETNTFLRMRYQVDFPITTTADQVVEAGGTNGFNGFSTNALNEATVRHGIKVSNYTFILGVGYRF